jgi:uncharacterized protein YodC (DUF2158 family)
MEDKMMFFPGDLVTLRQDLPNKPVMVVVRKESTIFRDENKTNSLRGIRCRWFTTSNEIQEAVWNTKDLIKLD